MDGAVKAMTPAERIASVDPDIREELIEKNLAGRGMKLLATDYRIPEGTVRAIIHDSKLTDRAPTKRADSSVPRDLWKRTDLWKRHGIKGPFTPRMVELTHERARRYRS